MGDYLGHLAAKVTGTANTVRSRTPSLFEPPYPLAGARFAAMPRVAVAPDGKEDVPVAEPRPSREEVPTGRERIATVIERTAPPAEPIRPAPTPQTVVVRPETLKLITQKRIAVQPRSEPAAPGMQPAPRRDAAPTPAPPPAPLPHAVRPTTPIPSQPSPVLPAPSVPTAIPAVATVSTVVREIIRPPQERANVEQQARPAQAVERPSNTWQRPSEPPASPVINVVIGRVTVQAVTAPAAERPKPTPAAPLLTLDRYLSQRGRK